MNEEMQQILGQIKGVIAEFGLFPPQGRVIVGLSGGADSMALTHFLVYHTNLQVLAAHVNHGLRGSAADQDEEVVRRWCEENGIPLRVLHADVKQQARERNLGLEECGREVRYAFFQELADRETDRIATAHTLSDQVETVLLHLTRGAGLRGLCGIPPVRGKIVRPFLRITREQVEAYCRFYHLPYVTDQTNADRGFARNRVRLDVVPALKAVNPALEREIAGMTARLARDEAYLQEEAQRAVEQAKTPNGYSRMELAALPTAGANPPACGRRPAGGNPSGTGGGDGPRGARQSERAGWNTTRRAGQYSLCGAEAASPLESARHRENDPPAGRPDGRFKENPQERPGEPK